MSAVLDPGLLAAVIVAAGVTALAAVGMTLAGLHRSARLTAVRSLGGLAVGLGVIGVAALGLVAVAPGSALAEPADDAAPVVSTVDDDLDIQLPTLGLDD